MGSAAALRCCCALCVNIVKTEQGLAEIATGLEQRGANLLAGQVNRGRLRARVAIRAIKQIGDHSASEVLIDAGFPNARQSQRAVRGDQQSGSIAADPPSQLPPSPTAELLAAVDDKQGRRIAGPPDRPGKTSRQPSLALVQGCPVDRATGLLQQRLQGCQEGRLAAAVRTDDLSSPAMTPQSSNHFLGVTCRGKEERHGAGPNEAACKGICCHSSLVRITRRGSPVVCSLRGPARPDENRTVAARPSRHTGRVALVGTSES